MRFWLFFCNSMRLIARFLFYVFSSAIAIAGLSLASVLAALYFFSSQLPDHNSLKNYYPDLTSRVYLQDGTKLCDYADEKRYFIPIDRIPNKLINAFIAVEDKNFFSHIGVDFRSIARSVITNLKNIRKKKRPQGASTITQQVARIFLIKTNEVSYIRKIKEAILSFRIENALSKKQILELYLNQIYMGMGTYGVATAAKTYFDKTLDELTIAECSYLASLAKGANNYHPVKHKEKALTRRNWAIGRQLEDGYISPAEAEAAKKEDLKLAEHKINSVHAEYFAEEIRKDLINKFPNESLNKKGLIIRCTLNPNLQNCAYNVLRKHLEELDRKFGWRGPLAKIDIKYKSDAEIIKTLKEIKKPKGAEEFQLTVVLSIKNNIPRVLTEKGVHGTFEKSDFIWTQKKLSPGDAVLSYEQYNKIFSLKQLPDVQGAIIVIEVNSGRILAMQGGYSFFESEFNRAVTAERQCGSVIKPFVYLTALDNGFSPNSIIDASPIEIDLGEKNGIWKPKNFGNAILDRTTMRLALERSINTATVRIAQEVGIDKIAKTVELFGIFEHMPHLFSYVLGAGETTLLKLTSAYAMLANGGKRINPTMIDYIQDRYGNLVFNADTRTVDNSVNYDEDLPPVLIDDREPIMNERSIYQITSLLNTTSPRHGNFGSLSQDFSFSCKTGTSNKSRDIWCIGYSPDIAVGVFVGFDDHSKSLGERAQGATIARPILADFMSRAQKYLHPKPFKIPNGIHLRKIDLETGDPVTKNTRISITEAFKDEDDENSRLDIINPEKTISYSDEPEENETNSDDSSDSSALIGLY